MRSTPGCVKDFTIRICKRLPQSRYMRDTGPCGSITSDPNRAENGGRMRKATIRDVAELAGVSTATVSRALSGSRPVSDELAATIKRATDSLGYSGNIIDSSLSRNRTDTVGLVVPSIENPFLNNFE